MKFDPWMNGSASWSKDEKTITGTIPLKAELGLRILTAEIVDEQFLVCTFGVEEASPLHEEE